MFKYLLYQLRSRIVDVKKIEAFGMSLGAVSAAMIFGLIKLAAISPFVVLGLVSAGGINLISRLLKNIPLINTKTRQKREELN